MNRKLFELIYLLILRQEVKPDEAYEMLKDFFRLNEIAEREEVKKLKPEVKVWDPIDLSKLGDLHIGDNGIIDNPRSPYIGDTPGSIGITWTGDPNYGTLTTTGAYTTLSTDSNVCCVSSPTSITCNTSATSATAASPTAVTSASLPKPTTAVTKLKK